jgi:integrase
MYLEGFSPEIMPKAIEKKVLTDRALQAMKPAAPGKRRLIWDGVVPSFGARITDKGKISFIVMRRLDGKVVRHTLGGYPALSLEQARNRARDALADIEKGEHPKVKAEAERREREVRRRDSFEVVAEAFIANYVAKLRSRKAVEAAIRRDLISRWHGRPVTAISRSDVIEVIRETSKGRGRYAAHKLMAYISKMFGWAIAQDLYGLERSPSDHIKPADLIGTKEVRQRVLSRDEMRLFWRSASEMGYPFGPLFRFLLLTGQRLHEVADMTWSELDLTNGLWSIPAERMKTDAPHHVPLSQEAIALLMALPRFKGDAVFSTTGGAHPVSGFSKAKARLEETMVRLGGKFDDPAKAIKRWVLHDLRRTARTYFSAIPSQDLVRELAISHTRPRLHKTYDQFAYLEEKRALFEAWGKGLMTIVEPPDNPNQVVPIRRVAGQ